MGAAMARHQPKAHAPAAAEACNKCHRKEHLFASVDVAKRISVIALTLALVGCACVSLLKDREENLVPISVLVATVNRTTALDHIKRKDRSD